MTREEALADGYKIDSYCYPNLAYKGPRFAPTYSVEVPTESEENGESLPVFDWTVIGIYPDNQIVSDLIVAGDPKSAFEKARADREENSESEDWNPVAAIKGGNHEITYGDEI